MQKAPLGVLVLHGFTGHLDTVIGLKPYLEAQGFACRFPVLRGHGTHFRDLKGVTNRDWYADAEKALLELSQETNRLAVVGLSMGGLVTLELAMNHPEKLSGIVTVAPALKFANPLAFLTPILSKMIPYWPSQSSFRDSKLAKNCKNYRWMATDALNSLYHYSKLIEKRLSEVKTPILILHSHKDQVIQPKSSQIIHDRVSSPQKELVWFKESGHEMMQDLEAPAVFEAIVRFLKGL